MTEGLSQDILYMQQMAFKELLGQSIADRFPNGVSAKELGIYVINLLDGLQQGSIQLEQGTTQVVLNRLNEAGRTHIVENIGPIVCTAVGSDNQAFGDAVYRFVLNHSLLRRSLPKAARLFTSE